MTPKKIFSCLLLTALFACSKTVVTVSSPPPSPVPTATAMRHHHKPSPSPSPTVKPTSTPTIKPTASPTPSPTETPTLAPTPTPTPLPTPTETPTPTPTVTPTLSPSPSPSPTIVPSASPSPSSSPTNSPTPEPTGPTHVQTGQHMGANINVNSPATYKPYLDWAYVKSDHMGLWQNAGIKTIFYTSPLQTICTSMSTTTPGLCATGDAGYNLLNTGGQYNSVAAKDCNGNLITGWYGANKYPVLFLDPTKSGAAAYFKAAQDISLAYINRANPGYTNAATQIFIDNDGPNLYNPSATPCGWSQASWIAATAQVIGASPDAPPVGKYQVNALGIDNIPGVQQALAKLNAANILSGDYEECYAGNSPANAIAEAGITYNWLATEYAEINTEAMGKNFWCYVRLSGDGASYIPWRLYTYASFLLSYDYDKSVIEEALSGGASGLNAFPEWRLVPKYPLVTATDVSGYLLPSGVYFRQWGECFYDGKFIGACAVVVNPSPTATVSFVTPYHHSLIISGDGDLDGGSVSLTGPEVQSLTHATAAILLP